MISVELINILLNCFLAILSTTTTRREEQRSISKHQKQLETVSSSTKQRSEGHDGIGRKTGADVIWQQPLSQTREAGSKKIVDDISVRSSAVVAIVVSIEIRGLMLISSPTPLPEDSTVCQIENPNCQHTAHFAQQSLDISSRITCGTPRRIPMTCLFNETTLNNIIKSSSKNSIPAIREPSPAQLLY